MPSSTRPGGHGTHGYRGMGAPFTRTNDLGSGRTSCGRFRIRPCSNARPWLTLAAVMRGARRRRRRDCSLTFSAPTAAASEKPRPNFPLLGVRASVGCPVGFRGLGGCPGTQCAAKGQFLFLWQFDKKAEKKVREAHEHETRAGCEERAEDRQESQRRGGEGRQGQEGCRSRQRRPKRTVRAGGDAAMHTHMRKDFQAALATPMEAKGSPRGDRCAQGEHVGFAGA